MTKISIKMFEAGNGDCFLLTLENQKKTNILVDFGYMYTFRDYVKKHLKEMKKRHEKIDLAVITHIDQDHISGSLHLFEKNGDADNPKIIRIDEVWHNSYRHLNMENSTELLTPVQKRRIVNNTEITFRDPTVRSENTSGEDGSRLAHNLRVYGYNWNSLFNQKAVCYQGYQPVLLNDDVKITILTPNERNLERLKRVWRTELRDKFPGIPLTKDDVFDDAVEYVALKRSTASAREGKNTSNVFNLNKLSTVQMKEDTDEVNGSSITFILECGDKKILMLGDSKAEDIVQTLKGLFSEDAFPLYFDAVKVSHHGSNKNISDCLLALINSNVFLISTNGKLHGHPDIETLAKIVTKPSSELKKIYFSHELKHLSDLKDEKLQADFQYQLYFKDVHESYIEIVL